MTTQSAVTVAAAILTRDEKAAPLALCVLHMLRDTNFAEMINTLVELNPVHWQTLKQIAQELQNTE